MSAHLDLEEQEQIEQLKHFWKQWGALISSVVTVAALAFAAYNGWQWWQQRQATQAGVLAQAVTQSLRSNDTARAASALANLQKDYASTQAASIAALQLAQSAAKAERWDEASAALQWVIEHSIDTGHRASARLQLAAIKMQQQKLDEALSLVQGDVGDVAFAALAADRAGDILKLQGKDEAATASWQKAWAAMEEGEPYRTIIAYKLNAQGIATDGAKP